LYWATNAENQKDRLASGQPNPYQRLVLKYGEAGAKDLVRKAGKKGGKAFARKISGV